MQVPSPQRASKNKIGGILTSQKLLKTHCDIPIAIIIILLKDIRHPFQHDTALHEKIETHPVVSLLFVGAVEEGDEGGGEPIAEGDERVGVFFVGDVAGAVFVEAVEEGAPGGEEAPEATVGEVGWLVLW